LKIHSIFKLEKFFLVHVLVILGVIYFYVFLLPGLLQKNRLLAIFVLFVVTLTIVSILVVAVVKLIEAFRKNIGNK